MQSSHLFINPIATPLHVNAKLEVSYYAEKSIQEVNSKDMYVHTLSERLWTSAARDLFVDVDPQTFFLASADSKSISFYSKTNRIEIRI